MRRFQVLIPAALGLAGLLTIPPGAAAHAAGQERKKSPAAREEKSGVAKPSGEEQDFQQAIQSAGNDRAALLRNLESFLKKYSATRRRPEIYRALVEASLQLRDTAGAANYAERLLALLPEDMSMTLVAIQLLDRAGEAEGRKRATSYATRILEHIDRDTPEGKSPRVSTQEWQDERRKVRSTVLNLRGRLYFELGDPQDAARDFEQSYALLPNAAAAEKLGELAELQKNRDRAIQQYARAFVLEEAKADGDTRQAIRRKLGNVWRLLHGSEEGLGEYLLRTYDETAQAAHSDAPNRNPDAHAPYDFTLRRIPDGPPVSLAAARGKVVVLSFWATWCGPCRALEPHFERVSAEFRSNEGVLFLSANCDEDETLVPPYLAREKLQTTAVYADGLNRLLAVNSYPTVIVLDRAGKISYRADGYDPEEFEKNLAAAVQTALASGPPAK